MEFRNESGLEFTDISSELWREYHWKDRSALRITSPRQLHVSDIGGHRIWDAAGVSHYIPAGWLHLCWQAKDGEPHFVK